MNTIKTALVASVMALAANADPTIGQVVVRQQWPWSTDVRIDYVLTGAESPVDIDLEFRDGSSSLSVAQGSAAVQGDVYYVENGVHTITVDPIAAFGTSKPSFGDFKVKLTTKATTVPDNKVLYKIVDLVASNVTDVTRGDLLLGKYGTVVTNYSQIGTGFSTPLTDVVIWTGVTADNAYKTTKLVLRRIPAGTFNMGSPDDEQYRDTTPITGAPKLSETLHSVTLTKDFWIGVFPLTQNQYKIITGSDTAPMSKHGDITNGDADLNPVYDVTYNDVRGSSAGAGWPSSHAVDSSSIIGNLRSIFNGAIVFDLPTEAQWERACRGGNEGANVMFNGKLLYANGAVQSADRNVIIWSSYNTLRDKYPKTQPVGGKPANPYGLYDMIGNVCEWVLDRAADFTSDAATNPEGPSSGNQGVVRGGDVTAEHCGATLALRSAFRFARNVNALYSGVLPGLRICVTEE